MPISKTNKEEIILEALKVFRKKSYYNTSMSDLAQTCGLQKGSFYHYFPSKEILMSEVLKTVRTYLQTQVFSVAYLTEFPVHERMEKMLLKLGKTLLGSEGGCIIGNTTLETSAQILVFKEILKGVFDDWKGGMIHLFLEKHTESTARRLAEQSAMEFEGAVMFSQLYDTDQYLKDVFVRTMAKMN
jgi:TetR/AcrR family transcriptional repressor of nem operon